MTNGDSRKNEYPARSETDSDRLRGILAPDALSVDLIAGYAGDRILSQSEEKTLTALSNARGELFFSDLLYAVTHQFFPPDAARKLWAEIVTHKLEMSHALKRNVQIVVATLDYMTNITDNVNLPTLVSEVHIAEIVSHSMRDGLTGLFNHTSFLEILELEMKRFVRHGALVSLILLDIDDFKLVNDRYGHQEGDRVLAQLSVAIDHATRESDICSRYGGEEFAVILPLTDTTEAGEIAERIRIESAKILVGDAALTVSAGVAVSNAATTTAAELIARADGSLYEAKRAGKNRVAIACE